MAKVLPLLLFALSAAGCSALIDDLDRLDGVALTAEYAIPVIDSEVTLADLIVGVDDRFVLTVDPDGLLRFQYSDTVPSVTSESIFSDLRDLGRGVPLPVTARETTLDFPLPNDASIRRARLKAGRLVYLLPNPYEQPVTVTLTLPNLLRDGEPFTVTGTLPARAGSGAVTLANTDAPIDLDGYELAFADNQFEIRYAIDAADGTPLDPGDGTIVLLTDLDFSYVEGFFGRLPYPGVDGRLAIDFFTNYLSGDVTFVDPRVVVEVRNSVGVPARAVVDELNVEQEDGTRIPVEGEVADDGFTFNYPREPGGNAYTTYIIDKSNSNLPELLDARPIALNYRISALINPDDDRTVAGFLADTNSYSATVTAELPLYGAASDFTTSDSIPVNLAGGSGSVTAATFRIVTNSELPLDVAIAGTFVDSLGVAVAELTEGEVLVVAASPTDANGDPTGSVRQTNEVFLPAERLTRIREARYLVLNTTFETLEGGARPVRLTADQLLRVRIGALLTISQP